MDWLIDAALARIGWAIGHALLGMVILIVLGIVWAAISAPRYMRQRRCKHARYRETSSCDAICNDCGKNLGFIGTIRDLKKTAA